MKSNFFSSFKVLRKQLNKNNDFLIFKYNNYFFSANKSGRQMKYQKHVLDVFGFLSLIIYFAFIRRTLLNNSIYIRVAIFIGLTMIFLEIGTILKILFDYNYCKRQVKESKATRLTNQDVSKNYFKYINKK